MLPSILKDVAYGLRQLRRAPGFTVVAVASLALGIGANSAILQLVDAIRLRPLPVPNPEELVSINLTEDAFRMGAFTGQIAPLTYGQWEQIRKQQQAFAGVLAWSDTRFDLTRGGESRFAEGIYVSGDFFRVLGVNPILGRTFDAPDDIPGCQFGAVISHGFWQRALGGDPGVLGRRLSLDGHTVPIVGVTAASFHGLEVGDPFDVAVPLCAERRFAADGQSQIDMPHAWWLSVMGRLRSGWTVARAQAHLRALAPAIMQATVPPSYRPEQQKRYLANQIRVTGARAGISELRDNYERSLWFMLGTSALVLLIACANLANLLLARARVREREIAVRLAIGASRGRLVRQLLVESLLLAAAGAGIGGLLARALSQGLVGLMSSAEDTLFIELPLDLRLLGFTAALAVLTCLLFGLVPALRATRLAPAVSLRSGGRGVTVGRERVSLRRTLVVTQVALSLVLLVGALLFARSLQNLLTTRSGFQADGVFSVQLDLARAGVPPDGRLAVFRQLHESLTAIPGVQSAAQVRFTPVSGSFWDREIGPDGAPAFNSGKSTFLNRVGPDYFRTMGTPLIAGRAFDRGDTTSAPTVAIVNEMFARVHYRKTDIVGRSFQMQIYPGKPEVSIRIVGVVDNSKYFEVREAFAPIAYLPSAQDVAPRPTAVFMLRVAGSPPGLAGAVMAAVTRVNPRIGIELRSFSAQLKSSLMRDRLIATLSGGFALLAVLLAMLGLYGVISYMVSQRRNEIGVRMALGADSRQVIRLVLRETVVLLGVGLLLGLLGSLLAGRAAAALLYGLRPHDPLSITISVLLLASTALLASFGPARRAARIEPMSALRVE